VAMTVATMRFAATPGDVPSWTAAAYVRLVPGEAYRFDCSHQVVPADRRHGDREGPHVGLCHSRIRFVSDNTKMALETVQSGSSAP
jgi:hypothetical protein